MNFIVLFFQLTSRLCLTNQLWPRNMSISFKSITAASNCSLCPLISIFRGATLVTSLFFVLSALKTSNEKLIGLICILFSLTSCSLIPVCVHPKLTSALILRLFSFFVSTSAYTFSSFSVLLCLLGIIYFFWESTVEISCTMPTWDHLQNPASFCYSFHYLILLVLCVSSLIASFYSSWQCVLLCSIWNISLFLSLSSLTGIPLPYVCTCCSWNILVFHFWNSCWTFWYPWAVLAFYMLFLYWFCSHFFLSWIHILGQPM